MSNEDNYGGIKFDSSPSMLVSCVVPPQWDSAYEGLGGFWNDKEYSRRMRESKAIRLANRSKTNETK